MKSCENCIHYEVCEALDRNGDVKMIHPNECAFYKDNSKFREVVFCDECQFYKNNFCSRSGRGITVYCGQGKAKE